MNKQWSTLIIAVLLLVFAGYVILDVIRKKEPARDTSTIHEYSGVTDKWIVSKVFEPGKGQLNAVTVSENGRIFLGGEPFIACYDTGFNLLWEYKTGMPVTALTVSGNSLFASVQGTILVLSMDGEKTDEWGPFENNSMITSLSANEQYVAFADAANKTVFILTSDNILYAANTGNRRIEKRSIDGKLLEYFGEPGTEPGAFCGCCNPAHFTLIPGGFITSEKGINRIKILNIKGEFVEFVSSVNKFVPPLPLDIASSDGKIIFGANPADSKIYVFKRK
jgi:hypothetical protein